MNAYILRRLLLMPLTVFVLSIFVFTAIRLVPGSVVDQRLTDRNSAEDRRRLEAHFGLDKPVHVQYVRWVGQVARGDFGESWLTNRSIMASFKQRMPVTLELTALTIVIYVPVGIAIGVFSAVRHNRREDLVVRVTSILGIAVPNFWLATLVIILPSLWWKYSPPVPFVYFGTDPIRNLQIMLPAAAISAVGGAAFLSRVARSEMLEVLRQDYVRTARAKGLESRVVIFRHALRNALLPLATIIGGSVAGGIAGAVITETIFNIPGMGQYLVGALQTNDLPIVQTWMLVFGTIVVLMNLLVDLSYTWLDPRVKLK